ncbi:MAG: hypothetical protein ACR2H5_14350 [Ktedonobacteraceae bacterium]
MPEPELSDAQDALMARLRALYPHSYGDEPEHLDVASPAVSQRQRSGRTSGADGPTKKKDFRFPVRLLAALKAVADDEQATDTQIIIELLKSDPRIVRKLFEDQHEHADYYVKEEVSHDN